MITIKEQIEFNLIKKIWGRIRQAKKTDTETANLIKRFAIENMVNHQKIFKNGDK